MLSYPTRPGDVDRLISDDHAVVEGQFRTLERAAGDRRLLVDQISFELALHAAAEERVVYPVLLEHGLDEMNATARAEHRVAKEALAVLAKTEPEEPEFEQALAALIAGVRLHVEEEETHLLPALRRAVGERHMAELGRQFLDAKRTAPTHAHPAAPSGGTAHAVMDGAAGLVDKLRDKLSGATKRMATDPTGRLDKQAQRILDVFASLEPKPFEILEPEQARRQPTIADAVRKIMDEEGLRPDDMAAVDDVVIDGPGGDLHVRVYTPTTGAASTSRPVLLWIHGGGWVLFDVDTYDASCRGMAAKTGAIVISPDYRRAPEHVFPAAHDDVLATFRWARAHASEWGGDPSRIAVGGESVGGTMAAATTWSLLQAGERPPIAQVLVYPLTTGEPFGESMSEEADARPLNLPLLSWMAMHAFDGVPSAASDPRIALLDLPADQLAGMPPTLVITDERDILRDQGDEFARHLAAAGVETHWQYYRGVMHEFFGAAAVLDKAQQAQMIAAGHLQRAFDAA